MAESADDMRSSDKNEAVGSTPQGPNMGNNSDMNVNLAKLGEELTGQNSALQSLVSTVRTLENEIKDLKRKNNNEDMQSEGITPQQKKGKLDKPSTSSGNQDESTRANYVGTSNLSVAEESDCEQESDNQANEITTKSSLDDIDNLLEEVEDESDSGTDNLLDDIDQYFVPKLDDIDQYFVPKLEQDQKSQTS